MDKRQYILKHINEHGEIKSAHLVERFNMSRQAAYALLKRMCDEGLLAKTGATKSSSYQLKNKKSKSKQRNAIHLNREIRGLEEDVVFNEISMKLNLKHKLSENSYHIINYAFTVMLNNAIDHSNSPKVQINFELLGPTVFFDIKDNGVGIFNKIKKTFAVKDDYQAIEHLFKGKQTTDPKRHSGQGIFFTSRVADSFEINSNKIKVVVDNKRKDLFLKNIRILKGTKVSFQLSKQSKRKLKEVFDDYSNENFEFDKNKVRIKLSRYTTGLLSRSEAKRLLVGLDKFSMISFDFKDVVQIGQAFADEIFRVYARNHPKSILTYDNASDAIAYLIERARKSASRLL